MYKNKENLSPNIYTFILKKSKELGIDHIGICSIYDYEKLEKKYKAKNLISIKEVFPSCKTIISAALSYNFSWNCIEDNTPGYIARYTVCNFYKIFKKKLKILADEIHLNFFPSFPKKELYSIFVNSKIDDKLCAYSSGIGSFTKNSLITTKSGNKVVLGEILLSVEFGIHFKLKNEIKNYCINCDKCIISCPTNALFPYNLIKERCLQYLSTIEEWSYKIDYIKIWGTRFFGCTKCLDVCPLNSINKKSENIELYKEGFIGFSINLEQILTLKKEDFQIKFNNNQLSAKWVKSYLLVRNALIALYNMKNFKAIQDYYFSIEKYNWDQQEMNYLKNFALFLLKLCNK